ncbi:MAG: 4-hydroxy-tetrahydrodipicolinate reductase [Syntrophomonadaceae bacterium]|nr:4-hydroxy-tetrahydrodipicolinate reductase [Syntrophomonadaceae bacterium]
MSQKIRVIVSGAMGKMGRETTKAVLADSELELVGLVDLKSPDVMPEYSSTKGAKSEDDLPIEKDLETVIIRTRPDVMIDFTNPHSVFNNSRVALKNGVSCVIGTTGLNDIELKQLEKIALENKIGIAVIPNFAIGAVLMMKFAREAAKYLPDVEIIELHHEQKIDAPSGTAIMTAEMINQVRGSRPPRNVREYEKIAGCRGGDVQQVKIHSVRLPGYIAHQEVIFGGVGQSLIIRHDSFDRVGFMQGVTMTTKKIIQYQGLIYGMEKLL